jgi:predicted ATPase
MQGAQPLSWNSILDAVALVISWESVCGAWPIRWRSALHRRSDDGGGKWCDAEVNRIAGEVALKSPERDAAKAEGYFQRALIVARQQQAKSWELRAAMSLARLWRDQGKVRQARELLAPVYGWFTEGFDTRDLKEAKALLEELAA